MGMKIAICGSMSFAREMLEVKAALERLGHTCFLSELTEDFAKNPSWKRTRDEDARKKIEHDLIHKNWQTIQQSDAVLVLNYTKDEIPNYVGGNSFLELGFGFILGKKLFLLHKVPEMPFIKQEILGMQPTVLDGVLSNIQ